MLAKVIDKRHPLSRQICEVGFKDGETYPLVPVGEPWHSGYARADQLQFLTHLGTGRLSWPNTERIAGRYGMVALFRPGDTEKGETGLQRVPWNVNVSTFVGKHGAFLAIMDEQEYDLGSGTFFTEQAYGLTYVGLKPDVPREEDWLNVDNLHEVDGMITRKPIDLYFVQG